MHGDHHIGTPKILYERDKAIQKLIINYGKDINIEDLKIYVVIPNIIDNWIQVSTEHLKYKNLIAIIHADKLNPESQKYYDHFDLKKANRKNIRFNKMPKCEPKSQKE